MEATLDKRNRVDLLDLKDQREGEGHIFFKSTIIRAKFFYANPPKVARIKLNQFLKVKGPSDQSVNLVKSLRKVNLQLKDYTINPQKDPLNDLFNLFRQGKAKKDKQVLLKDIKNFIEGRVEEESISFGSQSANPSIFMNINVDERLTSKFFDVEVSTLLPSILTKEKLYEVVKRLNILLGKSESLAKDESLNIIKELETQTSYAGCLPNKQSNLNELLNKFIQLAA